MKYLYLDDVRNPPIEYQQAYNVEIVRSYEAFVTKIRDTGLPDIISFDHDLGEEKSGYDCMKWLVEYLMDNDLEMPKVLVHSANPVGADNIRGLYDSYNKHVREDK